MASITKTCIVHGTDADLSIGKHNPTIKFKFTATTTRDGSNVKVAFTGMRFWLPGSNSYYGYEMKIYVRVKNGDGSYTSKKVYTKSASKSTWDVNPSSVTLTSVNNKTTTVTVSAGAYASDGKNCFSGDVHYKNYTVSAPEYDPTYTVTYDANGGINPPDNQSRLQSDPPFTLTDEVDRPQYPLSIRYFNTSSEIQVDQLFTTDTIYRDFDGWLCSVNQQIYNKGDLYDVNASSTMTAQWGYGHLTPMGLIDKYVTISFNPKGGEVSPATKPAYFVEYGYDTTASSTAYPYVPGNTYNITTDLDLYPKYSELATLLAADMPIPTRTGYIFDGWYEDEQYTTPVGNSFSTATDATLYAKWIPIPVHQFDKDGTWKDINQYVWQYRQSTGWQQTAPIYKFNGTEWINISEA